MMKTTAVATRTNYFVKGEKKNMGVFSGKNTDRRDFILCTNNPFSKDLTGRYKINNMFLPCGILFNYFQ